MYMNTNMNMMLPQSSGSASEGLQYLAKIDQILIKQELELIEVVTDFETANRYTLFNNLGQKIYSAYEDSNWIVRNTFCMCSYPFEMPILDIYGNEVIHLSRSFACCCCVLEKMEVYHPPGQLAGTVEEVFTWFINKYNIRDASGEIVLRIQGPMCTFSCGRDIDFKVLTADGTTQIGVISKKWAGLALEAFTDVDVFGATFPKNLDVRMKAVLIGAVFLIDYMHFEQK